MIFTPFFNFTPPAFHKAVYSMPELPNSLFRRMIAEWFGTLLHKPKSILESAMNGY